MDSSEPKPPVTAVTAKPEPETEQRAQTAADGLKGQIAALRDQVRQAQLSLRADANRKREPRSFNDET